MDAANPWWRRLAEALAPTPVDIAERLAGHDAIDVSILYAIEPRDGTKGLLVVAFGPYMSRELGSLPGTVEIHGAAM